MAVESVVRTSAQVPAGQSVSSPEQASQQLQALLAGHGFGHDDVAVTLQQGVIRVEVSSRSRHGREILALIQAQTEYDAASPSGRVYQGIPMRVSVAF